MCKPNGTRMIPPEKLEKTCGTCTNKVLDDATSAKEQSGVYICVHEFSDRCGQIVEDYEVPCDNYSAKIKDGERPFWGIEGSPGED